MNPAAVERFIRDTLGCGCPDEVFRDLRLEPADGIHDGAIHVGGRLLIFLLRGESVRQRLGPLLEAGLQRRDREGYHRARFVVISGDVVAWREAERLFDGCPVRDARTHLHLIGPEALGATGIQA